MTLEADKPAKKYKHGDGSVRQVEINGRSVWQVRKSYTYPDPTTGEMTRKRITGIGDTEMAAIMAVGRNEERWKAQGRAPKKTVKVGESKTVEELFYEWHRTIKTEKVSDIVRHKYLRNGELHILPHIGSMRATEVTQKDLEKLLWDTLGPEGKGLSQSARASIAKVMNMVFGYGVPELYPLSPMVGVDKPAHQGRDADEISLVTKKAISFLVKLKRQDDPNYCRYLFQFMGLRRSERLGLEYSNVKNLNGKGSPYIIINQQLSRYQNGDGLYLKRKTKTPAGFRQLPLVEPFLTALREYKAQQDVWKQSPNWKPREGFEDLVFLREDGSVITHNADNADWHEVLKVNGYDYWSGHVNRHVTATLLGTQNPPIPIAIVQRILGHGSQSMSFYYMAVGRREIKDHFELFGKLLVPERKPNAKTIEEIERLKAIEEVGRRKAEGQELLTDPIPAPSLT